jgi:methionyl-tRNA formyltransferase
MKILLLMNKNSYPGREYLTALKKAKINIDVVSVGEFPEIDLVEEERCQGYWNPEKVEVLVSYFSFYHFKSLNDVELIKFLNTKRYDFCIQGGTGILKKNIIEMFRIGIINFHPGDLPFYRGCSAPEWQLYENKPLISTAHLINEGIDSGEIIEKKTLLINSKCYHKIRALIYPETAKFLVELVNDLINFGSFQKELEKQDENLAVYRGYIGSDRINELKLKFLE